MNLSNNQSVLQKLNSHRLGRLSLFVFSLGLIFLLTTIGIAIADNYITENESSLYYTYESLGDQTGHEVIDWSSVKGKIYNLIETRYDNYLNISLSTSDAYQVEFFLDGKSESIIISTWSRATAEYVTFLYLIPEYIATRGYDSIKISPINGDGSYAVSYIDTVMNPKVADYPDALVVDFEIKLMTIEIDESDFDLIEAKRDDAVQLGILLVEDEDIVSADIHMDGKNYKTDVRLKGDWTDHLQSEKWSYRIKVKDDCILGMEKFSIQPPETRVGIGEYLVHELYRDGGGVALRYEFVDVIVNGVYKGVYAVEEAFDKRVVENSLKREGAILCYDEDLMWESWAYYNQTGIEYRDSANVRSFNMSKTLADEKLYDYATYGTYLLNAIRDNTIPAYEALDYDMFAYYYAVVDILGAHHGTHWHNMRYYYNPVTARLEPITFDQLYMYSTELSYTYTGENYTHERLFDDPEFIRLYDEALDNIVERMDGFLDEQAVTINQFNYILSRDGYLPFDLSPIDREIEIINNRDF
ncbi:MAG: CotH kinase family protein [Vallitaleaceae bacterium]|jgi:hypothetical protein|nr:CotH kinase family protein [Vallitaleaceae bacterium]